MAGIGFELKKLFSKKGLFAMVRAYGYAGVVCTGPMLLGMVLLIGIRVIAKTAGLDMHGQELLNCMITYTLLASLMTTNSLSMLTTRYVADMLYTNEDGKVIPSFYGSTAIMYIFGGAIYGVFLLCSGVPNSYKLCCFILFMELIAVWTQINYLTAVKDYQSIMRTFLMAVACALGGGFLLSRIMQDLILGMLIAVVLAYGMMLLWYYKLLIEYFPKGEGNAFAFLKWMDKYPQLVGVGLFMGIGLYAHLVMMWASPVGVCVQGLFYAAPSYDVPALFAFISILITSINFVTSVEVNFYPKYRTYFGLFNYGGTLIDIKKAEQEMVNTLEKELSYTFAKQFFTTVVFIVAGTLLIPKLPFGFTEDMLGIYRVLCVGYAFYAAGNCMMLMTLYFADNEGAFWESLVYAVITVIGTFYFMGNDSRYYGFGFLIGGIAFSLVSLLRLVLFIRRLSYHVISRQPLIMRTRSGMMTRISERLEARECEKVQKS